MIDVFWINARPSIFDCNDQLVGRTSLRPYCEYARAGWHCVHGFAGIHHKIEHDLLQLHPVGRDPREFLTEFGAN